MKNDSGSLVLENRDSLTPTLSRRARGSLKGEGEFEGARGVFEELIKCRGNLHNL
jgi:hypothetical protein